VKKSQRKVVVFSTLLGVLSMTCALLMALEPAPVAPDAASSLFAIDDQPRSMDAVFETQTPIAAGRWKYVYIHHSRTTSGNAITLASDGDAATATAAAAAAAANTGVGDHFVIGNGDGCTDGEIQLTQRWNRQLAATPPAGASNVEPAWSQSISICVVGDFDSHVPTPTQLRRLTQLVNSLQGTLHIDRSRVLLIDSPKTAAGAGRYFPISAFRGQLLP
jgi:hypothetical protein